MSLFGEFHVPSGALALHDTLADVPGLTIEIERVVATEDALTPYFWVDDGDLSAFEAAAAVDATVRNLTRLDEFEEATLYRAEWTENIETIVYTYLEIGGTILEATGKNGQWELRIRFDDQAKLDQFRGYCNENGIPFRLERLHQLSHPRSGGQYGLTPKQHDAILTAWKLGYFDPARQVSLDDVAAELGITQQSLSQRLQRAHQALVEHTLAVVPPD